VSDHAVHEGRRQTGRRSAHAGSGLKLIDASGRSRLICQPSSRTGENPPYGMIGRIEETSASFEARSAPRSHPTHTDIRRCELLLRKTTIDPIPSVANPCLSYRIVVSHSRRNPKVWEGHATTRFHQTNWRNCNSLLVDDACPAALSGWGWLPMTLWCPPGADYVAIIPPLGGDFRA
jgi:hypothetical protein